MKKVFLMSALWMGAVLNAASIEMDCDLFLNPYIETELKEVSGQIVLDAGCGMAPRSILAAQNGAKVCAFETANQLLVQAQAAVQKAGVESQISFCQGTLDKLPYESNMFDKAFYVHTATMMPATLQVLSQEQFQEMGFNAHFKEIARVMKEGGSLIVAAPASYDVVFSDGSRPEEIVYQHIQEVLNKIDINQSTSVIAQHLCELEEVLRATFIFQDGRLQLVTNEKGLHVGQPIWRKVPGGAITSIYHSEEEYLVALKLAGLTCEEIKRPCFFGKVKYDQWLSSQHECGKSLGEAYIHNHPFTLYYVKKA